MTTTPSEPAPDAAPAERRLHPLSWLFVLLTQLKQFALPLIALVIFGGRGDRNELWPLIGVGVLMAVSLLQYFTYRYTIAADELVIRSGWLQRNLRHIPFARIHNVGLHQTLLHRFFGVAEVRLESAGGVKPEAEMRVLRLADAQALEALVRRRAADAGATDAALEGEILLALDTRELVRLGLISNRGMIVVAAAFGALMQGGSNMVWDALQAWGRTLFGYASDLHMGWAATALAGLSLLLVFLALLRLLSVVLALLQFHGFTLRETDRRLQVQRGLLTRIRASAPRHRIQAWSLRESLLERWFGRRSLKVDTASMGAANESRGLRELAPIAGPETIDALIRRLLPDAGWPALAWQPLHPRAWRRLIVLPAALVLLACAFALWRFGPWGALVLLALPPIVLRARRWAQRAGYAVSERLVAVREGWLSRGWRLAELGKLQGLKLTRSPFDRRHGMATLWLDTAGANPLEMPLRIRFLPETEARALFARLGTEISRRKLRW